MLILAKHFKLKVLYERLNVNKVVYLLQIIIRMTNEVIFFLLLFVCEKDNLNSYGWILITFPLKVYVFPGWSWLDFSGQRSKVNDSHRSKSMFFWTLAHTKLG